MNLILKFILLILLILINFNKLFAGNTSIDLSGVTNVMDNGQIRFEFNDNGRTANFYDKSVSGGIIIAQWSDMWQMSLNGGTLKSSADYTPFKIELEPGDPSHTVVIHYTGIITNYTFYVYYRMPDNSPELEMWFGFDSASPGTGNAVVDWVKFPYTMNNPNADWLIFPVMSGRLFWWTEITSEFKNHYPHEFATMQFLASHDSRGSGYVVFAKDSKCSTYKTLSVRPTKITEFTNYLDLRTNNGNNPAGSAVYMSQSYKYSIQAVPGGVAGSGHNYTDMMKRYRNYIITNSNIYKPFSQKETDISNSRLNVGLSGTNVLNNIKDGKIVIDGWNYGWAPGDGNTYPDVPYPKFILIMNGIEQMYNTKPSYQHFGFNWPHDKNQGFCWPASTVLQNPSNSNFSNKYPVYPDLPIDKFYEWLNNNDEITFPVMSNFIWTPDLPFTDSIYGPDSYSSIASGGLGWTWDNGKCWDSDGNPSNFPTGNISHSAGYAISPYNSYYQNKTLMEKFGTIKAPGIVWDSSQLTFASWLPSIDKNPNSQYLSRYGYYGRDSVVNDELKYYIDLSTQFPYVAHMGEWFIETNMKYYHSYSGSVNPRHEDAQFPTNTKGTYRYLPLFEMVYGDCVLFTPQHIHEASNNFYSYFYGTINQSNAEVIGMRGDVVRKMASLHGAVNNILFGMPFVNGDFNGLDSQGNYPVHGNTFLCLFENQVRQTVFGQLLTNCDWTTSSGAKWSEWRADGSYTGTPLGIAIDNDMTGTNTNNISVNSALGTITIDTLQGWAESVSVTDGGKAYSVNNGGNVFINKDNEISAYFISGAVKRDGVVLLDIGAQTTPTGQGGIITIIGHNDVSEEPASVIAVGNRDISSPKTITVKSININKVFRKKPNKPISSTGQVTQYDQYLSTYSVISYPTTQSWGTKYALTVGLLAAPNDANHPYKSIPTAIGVFEKIPVEVRPTNNFVTVNEVDYNAQRIKFLMQGTSGDNCSIVISSSTTLEDKFYIIPGYNYYLYIDGILKDYFTVSGTSVVFNNIAIPNNNWHSYKIISDSSTNVCYNGSFEKIGVSNIPTGTNITNKIMPVFWDTGNDVGIASFSYVTFNSGTSYEGKHCVKIEGTNIGSYWQSGKISVVPNTTYYFSSWINSNGIVSGEGVTLRVIQYKSDKVTLTTQNFDIGSVVVSSPSGWQQKTFVFKTESDAGYISLRLQFKGTGSVLFDKVTLTKPFVYPQLKLTASPSTILADGVSISSIGISIENVSVLNNSHLITLSISGNGTWLDGSTSDRQISLTSSTSISIKSTISPGIITITANSTGLISGTTNIITIGSYGSPAKLSSNAQSLSLTANGTSTTTITTKILDNNNNLVENSTMTITYKISGQGSWSDEYGGGVGDKQIIASGGVAKIGIKSGTTTGTIIVNANSYGLQGSTVTVTTIPGPAYRLRPKVH